MSIRHLALICALGMMQSAVLAAPVALPRGKTQFEFVDQKGAPTRPVTVWMFELMLGEKDTDASDAILNKSAGANEQGRYLLARGEYFFAAAMRAAMKFGADFQWQKIHADNIGRDDARMAAVTVEFMGDPFLTDPAYLAPTK